MDKILSEHKTWKSISKDSQLYVENRPQAPIFSVWLVVKRPQGPHCLGLNPGLTDLRQVHISCLTSETRKVLGPACPSGDRVSGKRGQDAEMGVTKT